jgi:hypothetical protein
VTNQYWFARRFPVSDRRNSMSPITPEGYRVAWTFVGWMIGGACAALVLVGLGFVHWLFMVPAPLVFVACAAYGGWYFISQSQSRGDKLHTIEDYKLGRVK